MVPSEPPKDADVSTLYKNEYSPKDDLLPVRVLHLERDLTALDKRCRECSDRTKDVLRLIGTELGEFGTRMVSELSKINKRIDDFVGGPAKRKRKNGKE